MSEINEVVLFISTASKACTQPYSFVKSKGLPINVVRLDTECSRRAATQSKNFSISSVPSMVVTFEDGNFQLFVGAEKIMKWLTNATTPQPQPQHSETIEESQPPKGMYDKVKIHRPEDEAEIEFISDKPLPPPTDGLKVGPVNHVAKGGRMKDLMSIAKQMEKDRQASLGYREEDLPRSS